MRKDVETILEVRDKLSAFALCQQEKAHCDNNNVKIVTKNTFMECTKKIGFLVGIYAKIASMPHCAKDLNDYVGSSNKVIDVKKRFTHDRGERSRVLTVYAIEKESKDVDEISCETKSPMHQRVSCRNSTPQERVAAVCHDEMKNDKAKYETLF